MKQLLIILLVLMPSAALAQYTYGGVNRIQPQPYNPYPGRHVEPGKPMQQPNGPSTVYTRNGPKNCYTAGGVTNCN